MAVVLASLITRAQDHVSQGWEASGDYGNGTLHHGNGACQHRLVLFGVIGADD
jgi:hypothetical protein